MTPEEKLAGLLRLKQHEQPPADYFENFLEEFHHRQRASLMQQGSLSLLWERLGTWVQGLRRPAVIWSAAGAYAAIIALVCLWPKPGPSTLSSTVILTPEIKPPQPRNAVPVSLGNPAPLEPTGQRNKTAEPPPPEPSRDL